MNELGRYIDEMRKRHRLGQRILSKSQMAREAGLNVNAVQQLIAGRTGASPRTLKALAERWGTDEDYRELMRLAGHPLPEQWLRLMDDSEIQTVLDENNFTPDEQAVVLKFVQLVRSRRKPTPGDA